MTGISIVICSKIGILKKELYENIQNTVGSPFETLVIDNSKNSYSIFEAYNRGMKFAQYPYLLFLHEDVLFHTTDWGQILVSFFSNNPDVGLIGVAGSKIKTRMPSGWWETKKDNLCVNILQHYRDERVANDVLGFKEKSFEEVAVVDGVFLALRKDPRIKFNEKLNGFHHYDTSLSIDVKLHHYKIYVTNEILIEHLSTGNIDSEWVNSTHHFSQIYGKVLPIAVDKEVTEEDEEYSLLSFIYTCIATRDKIMAIRYYLKFFTMNPASSHHKKILKLLFSSKKPWVKI